MRKSLSRPVFETIERRQASWVYASCPLQDLLDATSVEDWIYELSSPEFLYGGSEYKISDRLLPHWQQYIASVLRYENNKVELHLEGLRDYASSCDVISVLRDANAIISSLLHVYSDGNYPTVALVRSANVALTLAHAAIICCPSETASSVVTDLLLFPPHLRSDLISNLFTLLVMSIRVNNKRPTTLSFPRTTEPAPLPPLPLKKIVLTIKACLNLCFAYGGERAPLELLRFFSERTTSQRYGSFSSTSYATGSFTPTPSMLSSRSRRGSITMVAQDARYRRSSVLNVDGTPVALGGSSLSNSLSGSLSGTLSGPSAPPLTAPAAASASFSATGSAGCGKGASEVPGTPSGHLFSPLAVTRPKVFTDTPLRLKSVFLSVLTMMFACSPPSKEAKAYSGTFDPHLDLQWLAYTLLSLQQLSAEPAPESSPDSVTNLEPSALDSTTLPGSLTAGSLSFSSVHPLHQSGFRPSTMPSSPPPIQLPPSAQSAARLATTSTSVVLAGASATGGPNTGDPSRPHTPDALTLSDLAVSTPTSTRGVAGTPVPLSSSLSNAPGGVSAVLGSPTDLEESQFRISPTTFQPFDSMQQAFSTSSPTLPMKCLPAATTQRHSDILLDALTHLLLLMLTATRGAHPLAGEIFRNALEEANALAIMTRLLLVESLMGYLAYPDETPFLKGTEFEASRHATVEAQKISTAVAKACIDNYAVRCHPEVKKLREKMSVTSEVPTELSSPSSEDSPSEGFPTEASPSSTPKLASPPSSPTPSLQSVDTTQSALSTLSTWSTLSSSSPFYPPRWNTRNKLFSGNLTQTHTRHLSIHTPIPLAAPVNRRVARLLLSPQFLENLPQRRALQIQQHFLRSRFLAAEADYKRMKEEAGKVGEVYGRSDGDEGCNAETDREGKERDGKIVEDDDDAFPVKINLRLKFGTEEAGEGGDTTPTSGTTPATVTTAIATTDNALLPLPPFERPPSPTVGLYAGPLSSSSTSIIDLTQYVPNRPPCRSSIFLTSPFSPMLNPVSPYTGSAPGTMGGPVAISASGLGGTRYAHHHHHHQHASLWGKPSSASSATSGESLAEPHTPTTPHTPHTPYTPHTPQHTPGLVISLPLPTPTSPGSPQTSALPLAATHPPGGAGSGSVHQHLAHPISSAIAGATAYSSASASLIHSPRSSPFSPRSPLFSLRNAAAAHAASQSSHHGTAAAAAAASHHHHHVSNRRASIAKVFVPPYSQGSRPLSHSSVRRFSISKGSELVRLDPLSPALADLTADSMRPSLGGIELPPDAAPGFAGSGIGWSGPGIGGSGGGRGLEIQVSEEEYGSGIGKVTAAEVIRDPALLSTKQGRRKSGLFPIFERDNGNGGGFGGGGFGGAGSSTDTASGLSSFGNKGVQSVHGDVDRECLEFEERWGLTLETVGEEEERMDDATPPSSLSPDSEANTNGKANASSGLGAVGSPNPFAPKPFTTTSTTSTTSLPYLPLYLQSQSYAQSPSPSPPSSTHSLLSPGQFPSLRAGANLPSISLSTMLPEPPNALPAVAGHARFRDTLPHLDTTDLPLGPGGIGPGGIGAAGIPGEDEELDLYRGQSAPTLFLDSGYVDSLEVSAIGLPLASHTRNADGVLILPCPAGSTGIRSATSPGSPTSPLQEPVPRVGSAFGNRPGTAPHSVTGEDMDGAGAACGAGEAEKAKERKDIEWGGEETVERPAAGRLPASPLAGFGSKTSNNRASAFASYGFSVSKPHTATAESFSDSSNAPASSLEAFPTSVPELSPPRRSTTSDSSAPDSFTPDSFKPDISSPDVTAPEALSPELRRRKENEVGVSGAGDDGRDISFFAGVEPDAETVTEEEIGEGVSFFRGETAGFGISRLAVTMAPSPPGSRGGFGFDAKISEDRSADDTESSQRPRAISPPAFGFSASASADTTSPSSFSTPSTSSTTSSAPSSASSFPSPSPLSPLFDLDAGPQSLLPEPEVPGLDPTIPFHSLTHWDVITTGAGLSLVDSDRLTAGDITPEEYHRSAPIAESPAVHHVTGRLLSRRRLRMLVNWIRIIHAIAAKPRYKKDETTGSGNNSSRKFIEPVGSKVPYTEWLDMRRHTVSHMLPLHNVLTRTVLIDLRLHVLLPKVQELQVPLLSYVALSLLKGMIRHLGFFRRANLSLVTQIWQYVPSNQYNWWVETPSVTRLQRNLTSNAIVMAGKKYELARKQEKLLRLSSLTGDKGDETFSKDSDIDNTSISNEISEGEDSFGGETSGGDKPIGLEDSMQIEADEVSGSAPIPPWEKEKMEKAKLTPAALAKKAERDKRRRELREKKRDGMIGELLEDLRDFKKKEGTEEEDKKDDEPVPSFQTFYRSLGSYGDDEDAEPDSTEEAEEKSSLFSYALSFLDKLNNQSIDIGELLNSV